MQGRGAHSLLLASVPVIFVLSPFPIIVNPVLCDQNIISGNKKRPCFMKNLFTQLLNIESDKYIFNIPVVSDIYLNPLVSIFHLYLPPPSGPVPFLTPKYRSRLWPGSTRFHSINVYYDNFKLLARQNRGLFTFNIGRPGE